ncbi:DUF2726 domain-containing protein [Coraliomargarita algicola]|uniref:DUF2726 domain-containing protein n=1 Tax=Coraliomargarita algicola TaxID=3092156 RepID=A0ABZ0RTA9_9BACT|nr:DUF2726 domain-containing protein [Coraliomargarita sp. J2-16]WPJ98092.1 DUF2726 domain-containing protein [Coraliomargarita sp. J2-16]
MDILLYIIIAIIVIAITFKSIILPLFTLATPKDAAPQRVASRTQGSSEPEVHPYIRRESILTPTELTFFNALVPVINGHWHIFTKVRLEDLITVRSGLEKKETYGFRSRIKSRHVDFVLCDKETLKIQMCIELDDSSHQSAKAKKADAFKDKAFKAAGLTLIRIPARRSYSDNTIKTYLFDSEPEFAQVADKLSSPPAHVGATPALEATRAAPENDEDPHARWKPASMRK